MTSTQRRRLAKRRYSRGKWHITARLATHQAVLWTVAPRLAAVITVIGAAITGVVVLAALFGPDRISERAFRIFPLVSLRITTPASDAQT